MKSIYLLLGTSIVVGCSSTPATRWDTAGPTALAANMSVTSMKGYQLAGAEYWPYRGSIDIKYPDEVLWGFYPTKGVIADGETTPNVDSANPAAIACAQKAFTEWQAFINTDPLALRSLAADPMHLGYDHLFYLWTNDYSLADAAYPPGVRPARLWYWLRRVPKAGRPPGFWKWESTLDQKGMCHTPDPKQIADYLDESLRTTEVLGKLAPACRGKQLDGAALRDRCRIPLDRGFHHGEDLEVTTKQVSAGNGELIVTLQIKNKLALPQIVEPGESAPTITMADGSPLLGNDQCGGGLFGRSSAPGLVLALDGDGELTWPITVATNYLACDGQTRKLGPGKYRASWLGSDIQATFEVGN